MALYAETLSVLIYLFKDAFLVTYYISVDYGIALLEFR